MTTLSTLIARKTSGSPACAGFVSSALLVLLGLLLSCATIASAQSSSGTSNGEEGIERAGYQIHQSIEVGYRSTDTVGNDGMYDTLVDLHTGPRLLEQTLSMKSVNHQGILFDDLYISSFGWGGEPENVLRARASKYQWYDLRGNFRRPAERHDRRIAEERDRGAGGRGQRGLVAADLDEEGGDHAKDRN